MSVSTMNFHTASFNGECKKLENSLRTYDFIWKYTNFEITRSNKDFTVVDDSNRLDDIPSGMTMRAICWIVNNVGNDYFHYSGRA